MGEGTRGEGTQTENGENNGGNTEGFRIERDSMGEMRVPEKALYGASTARAVENFPVSPRRFPRPFIQAIGWVKQAAAMANAELGALDREISASVAAAAAAVARGEYDAEFVVDIFQTGSGTSTNMNANEVIAHLATRSLGGTRVHPNDHVNAGQSSNDVIPTAIHVAVKSVLERAVAPALRGLRDELAKKADEFSRVLKSGRTHLQDAVPITLGQEFAAYAWQADASARRVDRAAEGLGALALGGTAVGTGVNTHPEFSRQAIARLSQLSGLALREAENHVAAQGSPDELLDASAALRSAAVALMKVANDIRWMASGPNAGIGELRLPAVQPGSSIMPGKINPVIAESLLMACAAVVGNDAAVATAAQWGNFELHTMWPLIADRTLESAELLAKAVSNFAKKLVAGIEADTARCEELLFKNASVATVLAPTLGYDRVAKWVHDAVASKERLLHPVEEDPESVRIGDQVVPRSWLTGPRAPES